MLIQRTTDSRIYLGGDLHIRSGGVAASGVVYLFKELFADASGPPITLPRTAVPGPGTLSGTQTRTFTITNGYLQADSGGSVGWSTQIVSTQAQTRAAGLSMTWKEYLTNAANQTICGWSSSITGPDSNGLYGVFHPASLASWQPYAADGAVATVPDPFVIDTWYTWQVVLRATGAFFYLKGGVYTNWQLVWVTPNSTTATLYGVYSKFTVAHAMRMDELKISQLGAPFLADSTIATQLVTTAVSGTTYAGVADGIFDLTVTAANPLALTGELRFRVQDASNYWTAYFAADGSFNLDSVAAGVATNRITVASVITAAALRIIRVRSHGSKINCYTRTSATASWTKRGAEINVSHLDTLTDVVPVVGAGWTLGALHVWNRTPATDAITALDTL